MERRLELNSGIEVELQLVPPYVLFKVERELQALPDAPTKEVDTAAGVQHVPIDDINDPRYQEWMQQRRDAESDQMLQKWSAVFSHGVKRWRKKPTTNLHHFLALLGLGYQWRDQPPDGWRMSGDLEKIVGSTGSRRLDYIYFTVLADAQDFARVFEFLMGGATELTEEEVKEAEESFRNDVEGDEAPQGEGVGHQGSDAVHGDRVSDEEGQDAE